ncbi:hypothetical protein ACFLSJ_04465 [Verrucomicrobiota bacterium]
MQSANKAEGKNKEVILKAEDSMMRVFWIIAATALLVLGCSDKGAQTADKTESGQIKGADVVRPQMKDREVEAKQGGPAGDNEVDPALKDYVYPGSELGGRFAMGNMLSLQYTSQDEFTKVVDHYKEKFPDTNVGPGTSVYFGKQNPDGSDLTVTLTKLDSGTQIILKLSTTP